MANPNVLHWYVENLSGLYPKASPLPIGTWSNIFYVNSDQKPFMNRVMKMLVTDRVHDMHEQFADRVFVATQCRQMYDVCVHAHSGVKKLANLDIKQCSKLVSEHMFHICVHGGGIDPSPKAWETIILGSIPIIEHSSLDGAYSQLPVAFVKNMTDFITWTNHTAVLQQWKEELEPYYIEHSEKRNQTLYRLKNLYWHAQITKHIPNYRSAYRHIEE